MYKLDLEKAEEPEIKLPTSVGYEGMTECPVETLEKAIVLHLFWTEGLTSF